MTVQKKTIRDTMSTEILGRQDKSRLTQYEK